MGLYSFFFGKKSTLYGKAAFLSRRQRRKLLTRQSKHGAFCVDGIHHLLPHLGHRHIMVLGNTGSGKSQLLLTGILRKKADHSFVCIDPSMELINHSKAYLEKVGFRVLTVNFEDVSQSLHFNPFNYLEGENALQELIDDLVEIQMEGSHGDAFWKDSSKHILVLCALALLHPKQAVIEKTLFGLSKLINKCMIGGNEIHDFMGSYLLDDQLEEYIAFMKTEEKVRSSVLSTARTVLSKINSPSLRTLLSEDSLELPLLREQPTALFIVVNESRMSKLRFPLSILNKMLLQHAMKPKEAGMKYLPLSFLLDEFSAYRLDPNSFTDILVTLRKRAVSLVLILQSLSQLEVVYGKAKSKVIAGNTVTTIVLPGIDTETAMAIEQRIGHQTLEVQGRLLGRPLLSSQDIRTLPSRKALLLHGNLNPVLLSVKPWYLNRFLKSRATITS
ncbi:type IV secretory system conjugative DNA transfer family protein [Aquimarina rhabdastrellae]